MSNISKGSHWKNFGTRVATSMFFILAWAVPAAHAAPTTISKAFGAATIPLNTSTTLTFTLSNPNGAGETVVGFTDNLPAGLVVATPNGLVGVCGGAVTAVAGTGTITLANGAIAANSSCTIVVNVTGTTAGAKNNTSGVVTSFEDGDGGTASASVTVVAPPTISKAFGAATIPLNTSTTLTFTLNNPNTGTVLNGIAFSDSLPAGLVVATPNGLAGVCGGAVTAVAGTGTVSLAAGTLAASTSCTIVVNVTGTTAGTKSNVTGAITSTEGGTGGTASASIVVVAPPTISKAFGSAAIFSNGVTSLSLTITNPNTGTALTGIAVTDNLPTALVVAAPNGLTGSCGGGTITAVPVSGTITLTGATLAASASCTFAVNVTSATLGAKINTTGAVSSTEGGTGSTATATLTINSASSSSGSGASATPTLTLSQPNGGETVNAGSTYSVFYSMNGTVQSVKISLSTDGGATFPTVLGDNQYPNGAYSWAVPMMTTTTTAQLKVEARNGAGSVVASVQSAANFTIKGTAPVAATPVVVTPTVVVAPPPAANDTFVDKTSTFASGTNDPVAYSEAERASPVKPSTDTGSYSSTAATTETPTIDVDKHVLPPTADKKLPCVGGTLLKIPGNTAVYYCGKNGKRFVFPSLAIYRSWYPDFSSVKTITLDEMYAIPLGGNVTYRPGIRMIKIQSDPKTYAISRNGLLRWVKDEASARALYGTDWNKKIDDVSDAFFVNYQMGDAI